jgi:hypothetical protein
LWFAGAWSGRFTVAQVLTAAAASVVLWAVYFVLGFRAFAAGRQANGLGSLLTIGVPLLTFALVRAGWPGLAAWTPPGMVYVALAGGAPVAACVAAFALGTAALAVAGPLRSHCVAGLRSWYDRYHGLKLID